MHLRRRPFRGLLVTVAVLAPASVQAQMVSKPSDAYEPAVVTRLGRAQGDSEFGAAKLALLTPDALQGPPTPAAMFAIAGLDRDQLGRYLTAYRAHMSTTWDARYGVASAVRMLHRAVEQGDEDAARYYGAIIESLWTSVVDQDRSFDQVVDTMLRKDQRKRYREWQARLARGAAEQGRLENGPSPG